MTSNPDISAARSMLLKRLMPNGVPSLWCPLLTHYDDAGRIDFERIGRQLDFLAPSVRGFLVPGSTGDGWQLTDDEAQALLAGLVEMAVERASREGVRGGDLTPYLLEQVAQETHGRSLECNLALLEANARLAAEIAAANT